MKFLQNKMRVAKIFKIQLIIKNAKARLCIILKKLFKKNSILFNDMKIKQRNYYFKLLTRRCNYNHRKRLEIENK